MLLQDIRYPLLIPVIHGIRHIELSILFPCGSSHQICIYLRHETHTADGKKDLPFPTILRQLF